MKDSDNVFVNSLISSDEGKQVSMLINDAKTQVALLGEDEKRLVKMFFRCYYRLLENCLARIKKLSGEKKLKFLVDTTIRNIFS